MDYSCAWMIYLAKTESLENMRGYFSVGCEIKKSMLTICCSWSLPLRNKGMLTAIKFLNLLMLLSYYYVLAVLMFINFRE
jgi:hypothetical protein